MIIQANCQVVLKVNDEKEIVLEPQEPIVIPARWAVPTLIECHEQVEIVSSMPPTVVCDVVWEDSHGQSRSGSVLLKIDYLGERWLLVRSEGQGRFVRSADIIAVNPKPLFRLAREAAHAMGTEEGREMAQNVVLTMCDFDEPESETPDVDL